MALLLYCFALLAGFSHGGPAALGHAAFAPHQSFASVVSPTHRVAPDDGGGSMPGH